MNKKDIKKWVKNAVEKGFDRTDVEDLLKSDGHEQERIDEILAVYDEQFADSEKLKLSFFQRRKLRKLLKMTKKKANESAEIIGELTSRLRTLNKKEKKQLNELKEQMVIAIIGNKKKAQDGLAEIFEVTDEDGSEITKEKLMEADVKEVEELLTELIEQLEKEI